MVSLIVVLIFAAIAGWFADLVIPGKMPYGWIGGIVAGIVGGLIGGILLPGIGPYECSGNFCYYLIPGIIGAIILAFLLRFLLGMGARRA
jgi:uncharacterized membrane protein YeaQ/YmgE (transglycosylase-associated protein family)